MIRPTLLLLLALLAISRLSAQEVEVDAAVVAGDESSKIFPLLRFATLGDAASVQHELQQGRDVNEQNQDGVAAVHSAVRYNHNDVLSVLIQAGANLNVRESSGWTPLMLAAFNGNGEAVQLLIENNADPLQANDQGFGAHGIAFVREHREITNYIAAAGLKRAIQNGDLAAARVMIQDGAPVNLQTESGATALMIAAHAGDLDLVTWLLQHPDIRPDFQEADGWTAVMFAAFFDHAPVVRALLDRGIDLGVRNARGETVFDLAQLHRRPAVMAVLNERLAVLQAHAAQQAAPQEQQQQQQQQAQQQTEQQQAQADERSASQASQGAAATDAAAAAARAGAGAGAESNNKASPAQPEKKSSSWLKW